MEDSYRVFVKKRKIKQLIPAIIFPIVLVEGWFYPLLGYLIPVCMLSGMGIALSRGRKWCDWLCPRGSFFDAVIKAISPKREIPRVFRSPALRIGLFIFLVLMMLVQIIKYWPDPYRIGMFFVILLSVTTVLGIILSLIFHPRTWCSFCPIGSAGNWLGRRNYPLKIDSQLCTECKICHGVCPILVEPFRFKKDKVEFVDDGDCLKCGLCVKSCPKKALDF